MSICVYIINEHGDRYYAKTKAKKEKVMKKIICFVLITIMTVSLMISVSAAAADYDIKNDGDLLYEVDFGASGEYAFIDGRGENWNKTNPVVSEDGKSVTIEYTDEVGSGENKGRARFSTDKLSAFDVKGRSYTVTFTIESDAYVGVMLDGNTGFVINPSLNTTTVGQAQYRKSLGSDRVYNGTGNYKQTYAIEIQCDTEKNTNNSGVDAYFPTVYNLYVWNELNENWSLARELNPEMANKFEWEEDYEYFYIAFTRYSTDSNGFDETGAPVTTTVSDMKIYKGLLDEESKGPSAVIEVQEPEEEPEPDEDTDGDANGSGATDNSGNKQDPAKDPEANAPDTKAPETSTPETEPAAKKWLLGCGASVAMSGVALASTCAAMLALKRRRKDD